MNVIQHHYTLVLGLDLYGVSLAIHQISIGTLIRPFLDIGIGFLRWLLFFGNVESETTGEVRSAQWTRIGSADRIR